MDSIFVLTQTNFEFFKSNTFSIGNEPYWNVKNRVCYHYGENPEYILHNEVVLNTSMKYMYDSYLHVNPKKPLYCISHYTVDVLKDMCIRLNKPVGLKQKMYDEIKKEIELSKS